MMKIDIIRVSEIPNKPKLDKLRSDYRRQKRMNKMRFWAMILLMPFVLAGLWYLRADTDTVIKEHTPALITEINPMFNNQIWLPVILIDEKEKKQ